MYNSLHDPNHISYNFAPNHKYSQGYCQDDPKRPSNSINVSLQWILRIQVKCITTDLWKVKTIVSVFYQIIYGNIYN